MIDQPNNLLEVTRPALDIAILTQGVIRADLMGYVLGCVNEAGPRGYALTIGTPNERPVCQNRNHVCLEFLERGPSHEVLMMIDEDMLPLALPFEIFEMMRDPKGGYDVVGMLSAAWKPGLTESPLYWVCARLNAQGRYCQDFDLNGDVPMWMDAVGSGVMLIARRVLEHPKMRAPFMDQFNKNGIRSLGHDYNFCRRAKALGFRVWIHPQQKAMHMRSVELLTIAQIIGQYEVTLKDRDAQIRALGGEPLAADRPPIEMEAVAE